MGTRLTRRGERLVNLAFVLFIGICIGVPIIMLWNAASAEPAHTTPNVQTVTCWEDSPCWQVGHPYDGKN